MSDRRCVKCGFNEDQHQEGDAEFCGTYVPDTMAQWLRWRYGSRPYTTGDPSKGWDDLSVTDKAYWEHEAAAVKRAVARGGFKEQG